LYGLRGIEIIAPRAAVFREANLAAMGGDGYRQRPIGMDVT
jgi:hypothetical protein